MIFYFNVLLKRLHRLEIQLTMKMSVIKLRRFEVILTPLSSGEITVLVSNLNIKKSDKVY